MSGKTILNAMTALAALGFLALAIAATAPADPVSRSAAASWATHQG